jgi:hypothetical protein
MTIPNDNRLRFLRDTCYGERSFYTSINRVEMISILDELIALREFAGGAPSPGGAEPNQPAVAELAELAERLAKVEDRLAGPQLVELSQLNRFAKEIHSRLDKVAEIIGERVSGLAIASTSLEKRLGEIDNIRAFEVLELKRRCTWLEEQVETLNPGVHVPFPTGGASTVEEVLAALKPGEMAVWAHDTAEAATDAVLPVPQRGDRVRLEGATSHGGFLIDNGWYNVTGQNGNCFQIKAEGTSDPDCAPSQWLSYVDNSCPGLKEVRHADHT